MKSLRNIILLAVMIVVTACVEDKRTSNTDLQQSEQTDNPKHDSVKTDLNENAEDEDSLQANFQETEQDTQATDSDNNGTNDQSSSYSSNDGTSEEDESIPWLSFLALGISALALLLSGYILYVCRRMEDEIWHEIGKMEKGTENMWNKIVPKFKECAPDKDCRALREDVDNLTARVNGLAQDIKDPRRYRHVVTEESEQSVGQLNQKRMGYFGIPRGKNDNLIFFNEYSDIPTDKSYFEMEFLDEQNCEFYPFDLEKLRSSDSIKKAIEFAGCSMQYARKMKLSRKGRATYDQENEYWRLTDKAKIELEN